MSSADNNNNEDDLGVNPPNIEGITPDSLVEAETPDSLAEATTAPLADDALGGHATQEDADK